MQFIFRLFSLLIFLFALAIKSNAQDTSAKRVRENSFVVGRSLAEYFPLDSVQSIKLRNWKGDHLLSKERQDSLISKLKNFNFAGKFAQIKPGHVWGLIKFKNGKSFPFYSNNTEMVISSNGQYTFITSLKVNFDNY